MFGGGGGLRTNTTSYSAKVCNMCSGLYMSSRDGTLVHCRTFEILAMFSGSTDKIGLNLNSLSIKSSFYQGINKYPINYLNQFGS